ncbi:hypothetical protein PMAYCL1PPCAC_26324, partial [Pristionchus mayeri]
TSPSSHSTPLNSTPQSLSHPCKMLNQTEISSDCNYEMLLSNTGTRVGNCYVTLAVTNGSAVKMLATYENTESQNAYMPYECGFQAESRNLGFGPDYGHHYGF